VQVDFRQLPQGYENEFEVCIIGAGAAGIALAKEFSGTQTSVCLIESGGLEWEDEIQALDAGTSTGTVPPRDLVESRIRYFGGTTNVWGGCCAPLDAIDFEKRSWVPHSGWPINGATLEPFYKRAQPFFELGPFNYSPDLWKGLEISELPFDKNRIVTRFFQESPPTNFAEAFGSQLEAAKNIDIFLYANVLNLNASENAKSITHIEIGSLNGKRGKIKAKYFVLACGGIENARLLLLSDNVQSPGLGNDNGLVGRFYMDHIYGRLAQGWTTEPDIWQKHGLTEHDHDSGTGLKRPSGELVRVRPFACLSDTWQRENGVLNIGLLAEGAEEDTETFPLARQKNKPLKFRAGLIGQSETAPNPDSRVTLSEDLDEFGLRRVNLDWKLSEIDMRTQAAMATAFGTEMARLDFARLQIDKWIENQDWSAAIGREEEPLTGTCHHIGTTRMASSAQEGVVDSDCAVHGMPNLYIAGSSVFPTTGFANPTLTIVALAIRIADQLKEQLA
jgi:choline dehydrogenase-like flavoprotein